MQNFLAVSVPAGFIVPYADDTVVFMQVPLKKPPRSTKNRESDPSKCFPETRIPGKKCPEANRSSRNDGANTSESQ